MKSFLAFTLTMFLLGWKLTVKHKFLPSFDVLLQTGTELYIAPWTRVMPYCVGVASGWYLNTNRKTFTLTDVRSNSITSEIFLYFFLFTETKKRVLLPGDIDTRELFPYYNISRYELIRCNDDNDIRKACDSGLNSLVHCYKRLWI